MVSKNKERRKHVTVIRSDKEREADQYWAEKMQMSVHAWRRLALNIANGLSRIPSHWLKNRKDK